MDEVPGRTPGRPPSVDRILRSEPMLALIRQHGRELTLTAVRGVLSATPPQAADGFDESQFAQACEKELEAQLRPSLRPVFNLTGTVLHTNLGRALLPEVAVEGVRAAMTQASNLEFDLGTAARGERDAHVEGLVCRLTGAEAATVVNNNAAAVLILLNTFALGREAIVSRGELVEIGGSFRIPDVMERAGVILREVGTTNRTHLRDFAEAVGPRSAVVLKVHTSNYRIVGFTAAAAAKDLAELCGAHGLVFAEDLGSGTLVDLSRWSLPREPTVRESLAHAALVTFSGDKLLGGVQCGIIAGRRILIEKIRANPLKRALRVDKITLAAMEAVLRLYLDPDRLCERLPTLRLLSRSETAIQSLTERLQPAVAARLSGVAQVRAIGCRSQIGSGALPLATLPSAGLAIRPLPGRGAGTRLAYIATAFLELPMPVIGRLDDGALCFDFRTLEDENTFVAQLNQLSVKPAGERAPSACSAPAE